MQMPTEKPRASHDCVLHLPCDRCQFLCFDILFQTLDGLYKHFRAMKTSPILLTSSESIRDRIHSKFKVKVLCFLLCKIVSEEPVLLKADNREKKEKKKQPTAYH